MRIYSYYTFVILCCISNVVIIFLYNLLKMKIPELLLLCVRKPRVFYITTQHNKTRVLDVIVMQVQVYTERVVCKY